MFQRLNRISALVALIPLLNGGCDPSNLAPGLAGDSNPFLPDNTSPSIAVTPGDQDIDDQDYAFLYASTANLPEPSTDNDGIHAAAQIRWTIVSGTDGLNLVDSSASLNNAKTIDTDPATDLGGAVLYFPDLGTSGEVVVKAELIRPTDRTVINEFGEALQEHEDIILATSQAVIHVNDELRLKLTPPVTTLPAGGRVSLKAILEALQNAEGTPDLPGEEADAGGGDAVLNIRYEWNMTGLGGAGDLQSSPDSDTAGFTAFSEAATFTVTVKAIEVLNDGGERVNGPASATVKVDPKLRTVNTLGYYLPKNVSTDPAYHYTVAWVYFPKIEGAISYRIVGQGMHDNAYYGTSWSMAVEGPPPAGGSVEDTGSEYRVGLSSSSSAASGGDAIAWMDSRFSGMRVIAKVTVAN